MSLLTHFFSGGRSENLFFCFTYNHFMCHFAFMQLTLGAFFFFYFLLVMNIVLFVPFCYTDPLDQSSSAHCQFLRAKCYVLRDVANACACCGL